MTDEEIEMPPKLIDFLRATESVSVPELTFSTVHTLGIEGANPGQGRVAACKGIGTGRPWLSQQMGSTWFLGTKSLSEQ